MREANTPALLRQASFVGAPALQAPLNDVLKSIQERLARLEQAQGIVLLGPKRIRLPVDAAADVFSGNVTTVDFQLPENFTPRAVFLVGLETVDVPSLSVIIMPAAITYEVTGQFVRVTRITTACGCSEGTPIPPTAGVELNLTLGAIRG